MESTLTISENLSDFWKYGPWAAALLSIIFTLIFWNITNVLWVGIFRLTAFICFSFVIFGLLKRINGPLQLNISYNPQYLFIEYTKKGQTIHKEKIERSAIRTFTVTQKSTFINQLTQTAQQETLRIHFQDGEHPLPLFQFDGRTLFFDPDSIAQTDHFLQNLITNNL